MTNAFDLKSQWERLRQDDEEAMKQLYTQSYAGLLSYAVQLSNNNELAKDVLYNTSSTRVDVKHRLTALIYRTLGEENKDKRWFVFLLLIFFCANICVFFQFVLMIINK